MQTTEKIKDGMKELYGECLSRVLYWNNFDLMGSFDQHFGIFKGCEAEIPYNNSSEIAAGCC